MPHTYSLAYLTSAPLAPPEALTLGAKLGYDAIGVRIAPALIGGAFSPLTTDARLLRETVARIKATGVAVFDVEIVRINAAFNVTDWAPFLDVCAALGARAILVAGDDPDEARFTASFSAFCTAAATYNLTADLEFMPWTKVPDCRTALRIVTTADQLNGRVLIDTLHAGRSTTTLADLKAVPRNRLSYVQLCDAPAVTPATVEGLIHTARAARLLPGEGGLDLVGMLRQLPTDLPLSLEIPNDEAVKQLGIEAWCRNALVAAKAVVAAAR